MKWTQADLFQQMTKDYYFSIHFMLGLAPNSNLRRKILKEINSFQCKQDSGAGYTSAEYYFA
jgi:hypothetical protein